MHVHTTGLECIEGSLRRPALGFTPWLWDVANVGYGSSTNVVITIRDQSA